MNKFYLAAGAVTFAAFSGTVMAKTQPNVLWIVTDDQRADALACFNRATRGTDESALGYVSSPELDKLAKEGVIFTRAYCNSPASAPSRASMQSGLYPHHRGVYGFEFHERDVPFQKPTVAEYMNEAGYNTMAFGKLGTYTRVPDPKKNGRPMIFQMYSNYVNTKHLQESGHSDWWSRTTYSGENAGSEHVFRLADGTDFSYYTARKGKSLTAEDKRREMEFAQRYDVLSHIKVKGETSRTIIGGVSPQPASKTTDGYICQEVGSYFKSEDATFSSVTGAKIPGPKGEQPQFVYIGHHFPHTPVLPSQSFRERFKGKQYKVPAFDKAEFDKMPAQVKVWQKKATTEFLDDAQKQQYIRDYYAFCAMGDSLIGAEVRSFKEYCKRNKQEYLIVIATGDHSWHLGEQGTCTKFESYESSNHTAVIVVSSDKKVVPANKVVDDFVEYVDFMPTFLSNAGYDLGEKRFDYLDGYNLKDVISGQLAPRDYTLGEINHVCGPHGHIRTKDFMFGMRTRLQGGIPARGARAKMDVNEEMRWALDTPLEEVDPILYDLRVDPLERNNVALDPEYRKLAEYLRKKVATILMGDGRIECNWKGDKSYKRSTFALGSDDKKLDIPKSIIPKK